MTKRRKRVSLATGLVGLVAGLTLVIAGTATADHGYEGRAFKHVLVEGNPRCPAGTGSSGSTEIDTAQLTADYNDGRIDITQRGGNPDAVSFQLVQFNLELTAVIVKAGDAAYIYYYEKGAAGDADENLTPPVNNGDNPPEISHVEFCFDPKAGEEQELTVEKTASGTSRIQHSWEIDKQVKVAGADDATYGDNAKLA